jgi:hypothetical protein
MQGLEVALGLATEDMYIQIRGRFLPNPFNFFTSCMLFRDMIGERNRTKTIKKPSYFTVLVDLQDLLELL